MDTSTTKFNSKSRKGCSECKRKRVKCDETKPVCVRCQKSRTSDGCDYNLKLSWTQGRPFKKRKVDVTKSPAGQSQPMFSSFDANLTPETPIASTSADGGKLSAESMPANAVVAYDGNHEIPASWVQLPAGPGTNIYHEQSAIHSPLQSGNVTQDDNSTIAHPSSVLATTHSRSAIPSDTEDYEIVRQQDHTSNIPPSLSSYPLLCPSESPNAYFFLHHYSIHTATTLFPLLPPAARDSLLSVAATTPHLLSALLAISADQYNRLRGDCSPSVRNRALFFKSKALIGLQTAMNDPVEAISFSTISTVLALCTSDIVMSCNVQGWKAHLRGAEKLLTMAIGQQSRSSIAVTSPSQLFLVKWFAAMDMFAGVSSLEKTLVPDGRYWSLGTPSRDGSPQYVDDFVGFSLELMPILSRISRMARLQQRKSTLATRLGTNTTSSSTGPGAAEDAKVDEDLDALVADNIAHTESQLSALFSRVFPPSQLPASRAREAQSAHQLFVYAALLHLHRRVQELPKDDPKVEFATAEIIRIIGILPPDSPASIVILWPLFSAGCETDDWSRREVIRDRMRDLRRYGMGNVDVAIRAMEAYWESDAGERWDVFLERRGLNMVLF